MQKILENIKRGLWSNIWEYCICWSGKKYIDCCENWWNDFWNLPLEDETLWEQIIKSKWERKADWDFNRIFWNDISDWECILKHCNDNPIGSHFYPKWYLNKHSNIFITWGISTWGKIMAPIALKTPLFCVTHDHDLFIESDSINKFSDFVDNDIKRNNWFLKILFFKYKTLIILLRRSIVHIKSWNCWYEEYYEVYRQYNLICIEMEKYNHANGIKFFPIKSFCINDKDTPLNVMFSNICFIQWSDLLFWIIFTYDEWWLTVVIWTYWKELTLADPVCKEIVSAINFIRMEVFEKDKYKWLDELINFVQNYFNLKDSLNRMISIKDELCDIWLYSQKS